VTYNLEDCVALRRVTEFICAAGAAIDTAAAPNVSSLSPNSGQ